MSNRSSSRRRLLPVAVPAALLLCALPASDAAQRYDLFKDQLFQQCINWMLDGSGGSMIDNRCSSEFGIPPPSIFMCARKVMIGFSSANDQEGCAIIFEEQARKVRAGYVK
jgi:hypothetical protein